VLLGAHCGGGIKGAIDRAGEIGADALQLFVQSPRTWRFPDHDPAELEHFRERRREAGLGAVIVHALYLVNLASPNNDFYEKSVSTMRSTTKTACALGAEGVVFHVGSHQGAGFEAGLERVVPALEQVLELCAEPTWLLLENSAGAGGTIGCSPAELATIVERLDRHPLLGVCFDSCHLYVSGYDVTDRSELDRLLDEVDSTLGLDRVRCLHVNDSKAPLGSNRDRHENIGQGLMGEQLGVFLSHPVLQALPALLETPGQDGHGPDAREVSALRDLYGRWEGKATRARRPRSRTRRPR
jgi:deoxyribonuclease IV